jgi:hypothetical protein
MKRLTRVVAVVLGVVVTLGLTAHVVMNYVVPYVIKMHTGG